MLDFDDDTLQIDLQDLVNAYAYGVFPMANSHEEEEVSWIQPTIRGIMPLDNNFRVRRSLRKQVKRSKLKIRVDTNFKSVMQHCAIIYESKPFAKQSLHDTQKDENIRDETWINPPILKTYCGLHDIGLAHSVECYNEENKLVGGLYGLMLGRAFFGESMFSLEPYASQIALINLVSRLRVAEFRLLDCQFVNDHLSQFGIQTMEQKEYTKTILTESIYEEAQVSPFDLSEEDILKEQEKVIYNLNR